MTLLYHYNNSDGLHGIITTQSVWASDHRFLNDHSELSYGLKIINQELVRYAGDIERAGEDYLLIDTLRLDNKNLTMVALVACFSSEEDLLSQWRGYNGGKGYVIGFDEGHLRRNANVQKFDLVPVIYDEERQQQIAKQSIKQIIEKIQNASYDENQKWKLIINWFSYATKLSLSFKNKKFCEESEYRAIYVGNTWPSQIKTRSGKMGLIPYYPLYFNKSDVNRRVTIPQNAGVEKIIVGPALSDHQIFAVDALLTTRGMRLEIVKSDIPYIAD